MLIMMLILSMLCYLRKPRFKGRFWFTSGCHGWGSPSEEALWHDRVSRMSTLVRPRCHQLLCDTMSGRSWVSDFLCYRSLCGGIYLYIQFVFCFFSKIILCRKFTNLNQTCWSSLHTSNSVNVIKEFGFTKNPWCNASCLNKTVYFITKMCFITVDLSCRLSSAQFDRTVPHPVHGFIYLGSFERSCSSHL